MKHNFSRLFSKRHTQTIEEPHSSCTVSSSKKSHLTSPKKAQSKFVSKEKTKSEAKIENPLQTTFLLQESLAFVLANSA